MFTSLYHHIADIDNLRESYHALKANKAMGIDHVTKSMYAEDLEANLQDLSARLKRMGYRPQAKRRSYIPKPGSEKGRPLGISSFEDKIVELTTKRVLEPIFESMFEDCSYGYRPRRSPHDCLDALGKTIQQKRVNHIVEADIGGFFDRVNHAWLLKFLQQRIGDQRVLRLITRMLKAGILEDGLVHPEKSGPHKVRFFLRCCLISISTTYWICGSSVGYRGVVGARLICSDLPTIVRHEGAKEDGVLRAAVLHK